MNSNTLADLFRIAAFVLYFMILGQTVSIVATYLRWRRAARKSHTPHGGLLPNHVILLGLSLVGADTEAVVQNYSRIGQHFAAYAFINPILFAITNFGLALVMRYEWLRFSVGRDKT